MTSFKLFTAILVFLIASFKNCYCFENQNYKVWRSSDLVTVTGLVKIATGSVILDEVQVTSGEVGSTFNFFNSTSSDVGVVLSSSSVYDLGTTGTRFVIHKVLRNGLWFQKKGGASIHILWDYYFKITPGNENLGRD